MAVTGAEASEGARFRAWGAAPDVSGGRAFCLKLLNPSPQKERSNRGSFLNPHLNFSLPPPKKSNEDQHKPKESDLLSPKKGDAQSCALGSFRRPPHGCGALPAVSSAAPGATRVDASRFLGGGGGIRPLHHWLKWYLSDFSS